VIGVGAEDHCAAIGARKGLEAFEDALAVMCACRRGIQWLRPVGNDARLAPRAADEIATSMWSLNTAPNAAVSRSSGVILEAEVLEIGIVASMA
jgi:hypothetical protein